MMSCWTSYQHIHHCYLMAPAPRQIEIMIAYAQTKTRASRKGECAFNA